MQQNKIHAISRNGNVRGLLPIDLSTPKWLSMMQ